MKKIVETNNLNNNVVFTGKVLDVNEKSVIIKNSNLLYPDSSDSRKTQRSTLHRSGQRRLRYTPVSRNFYRLHPTSCQETDNMSFHPEG